jgi:hypothetical protein
MKIHLTEAVEKKRQMKSNFNIAGRSTRVLVAFAFLIFCWSASHAQGNVKGHGGQMPAFYEGEQITISSFEVPASDPLLANNPSVNTIYATNDLDDPQDFFPVIDAITGHDDDRFNPLWEQVLIVFNPGVTPHQFTSEDEVLDAAGAGEITLVDSGEVYRCSIVGGH